MRCTRALPYRKGGIAHLGHAVQVARLAEPLLVHGVRQAKHHRVLPALIAEEQEELRV